ncbi:MAG: FAD-dependent oxidoreductase [Coriobacteriales bacterium]|jgi:succinate dehydrogenase/fumarate reductase flavoprotein subunit|nr:FAD-dependent oxidoreductase [Coriobacteriales bacterium]
MSITKNLTRRSFLKGAAVASIGVATTSLASCSDEPQGSGGGAKSRTWDKETDVLIIGYGSAGACAAITACEAGASVLIIEKMEAGGGNSICALGGWTCPTSSQGAYSYIMKQFEMTKDVVDEDIVRHYADESVKITDWMKELDPSLEFMEYGGAEYSDFPGAESIVRVRIATRPPDTGGMAFFRTLSEAAESRGAEVMLKTPAKELITDDTGMVIGCLAESGGKEIAIKAKKGVVLAAGSYENDPDMRSIFFSGAEMHTMGTPGNTGDGVRMAQKVGAGLIRISNVSMQLGHKNDTCPASYKNGFVSPRYFQVNITGKRYANEPSASVAQTMCNFSGRNGIAYANNPSYFITDEEGRLSGGLCTNYAYSRDYHTWSNDNSEEIALGWVKKGDTFEELASKFGIDPKAFAETGNKFNDFITAGKDTDFGRDVSKLTPLVPPFYGIEYTPALFSLDGGPRRNAKGQILDAFGKIIPHLYGAGEAGTMWGTAGQGAGHLGDCIVSGKIAGITVAAETSWS